jgi:regulatory protein
MRFLLQRGFSQRAIQAAMKGVDLDELDGLGGDA